MTELTAKVEALRAASPPLLVTVQEAAAICKVSVPTMRRWVKGGQVPVVKVASTVRVDLSRVRGVDAKDIARMAREARGQRQAAMNNRIATDPAGNCLDFEPGQ